VFASAGDVGSSCPVVGVANGVPGAGLPDQSYPASSPYVMGAGGTTLTVNSDNSYNMEISWDAGGGGMEALEFSPFWQQPVLPTGAVSGAASPIGGLPVSLRGVPDVAMDADFLLSPAAYVLDGADTSNGGTSLASPLSTGCYARLQSRDYNQLGNAGPLYYSTFITAGTPTATVNAMHDITVGANGMYTALPGYDYNTGIGTCDIAAMAKLLPTASAPPTSGTTTGGTTGATTGGTTGTTTGTTTGGTTGSTTGTTTGSTTGGTTGGSGTTPPATTASATASSADPRLSGGGSAAPLSLLALGVAAWTRRRRKTRK
jgi:subtilase family serine protease